jgi:Tub family
LRRPLRRALYASLAECALIVGDVFRFWHRQIYDGGVNPKDQPDADEPSGDGAVRVELAAVMYAANVLGSRGPRKMQVSPALWKGYWL